MNDSTTPSARALLDSVAFTRRLARRLLPDDAGADDVAQDALLIALNKPSDLWGNRGWFAGVVRNLVRGHHRQWAQRTRAEQQLRRLEAVPEPDPSVKVRQQQRLIEAVLELDEASRTAVILRYFHDKSAREIGLALGIREEAVRKRVSRALAKLRRNLEREFAEEPGGYLAVVLPLAIPELPKQHAIPQERKSEAPESLGPETSASLGIGKWIGASLIALAGVAILVGTRPSWLPFRSPSEEESVAVEFVPSNNTRSASQGELKLAATREQVPTSPQERTGDQRQFPLTSLSAPTTVTVLDEAGQPVPGALVWTLDQQGSVHRGKCDEHGQTTLDSTAQALAAWSAGLTPGFLQAPMAASPRLTLGAGQRLAGTVFVEGERASGSDTLELTTVVLGPFEACPPELMQAVQEQVPSLSDHQSALPLDDQGEFLIEGLPAEWSGRLLAADGFQFVEAHPATVPLQPASLVVRQPRTDLRLELQRTPCIAGNVHWSDTNQPVAEGTVEVCVLYADGNKSYLTRDRLDELGAFSVGVFPYADPYGRPAVHQVQVDIRPAGGEFRRVQLDEHQADERGVWLVDRTPDLHFQVVDRQGNPVPRALVAGKIPRDYGIHRAHVFADDQGRGRLRNVPLAREFVLVGATGFRARSFVLGTERGTPDVPRIFELQQVNRLSVRLDSPNLAVDQLTVELTSEAPLLATEPSPADVVGQRFLEILGIGPTNKPTVLRHYVSDEDDVWELSDLRPGMPVEAVVRGPGDVVLTTQALVTPNLGQWQSVTLPVSASLQRYFGKVVDREGRGVAGVRVCAEWESRGRQWLANSDSQGEFTRRLLATNELLEWIWLDAPGFATTRIPPQADFGDLGELLLLPGNSVDVVVREVGGRQHRPEKLWAVTETGYPVQGQFLDGRHRLVGLPSGGLELKARLGGRTYSQHCSNPTGRVTFDVPTHGTFFYEVPDAVPDFYPDAEDWLRIQSLDEEDVRIRMRRDQPLLLPLRPGRYVLEGEGTSREFRIKANQQTTLSANTETDS